MRYKSTNCSNTNEYLVSEEAENEPSISSPILSPYSEPFQHKPDYQKLLDGARSAGESGFAKYRTTTLPKLSATGDRFIIIIFTIYQIKTFYFSNRSKSCQTQLMSSLLPTSMS